MPMTSWCSLRENKLQLIPQPAEYQHDLAQAAACWNRGNLEHPMPRAPWYHVAERRGLSWAYQGVDVLEFHITFVYYLRYFKTWEWMGMIIDIIDDDGLKLILIETSQQGFVPLICQLGCLVDGRCVQPKAESCMLRSLTFCLQNWAIYIHWFNHFTGWSLLTCTTDVNGFALPHNSQWPRLWKPLDICNGYQYQWMICGHEWLVTVSWVVRFLRYVTPAPVVLAALSSVLLLLLDRNGTLLPCCSHKSLFLVQILKSDSNWDVHWLFWQNPLRKLQILASNQRTDLGVMTWVPPAVPVGQAWNKWEKSQVTWENSIWHQSGMCLDSWLIMIEQNMFQSQYKTDFQHAWSCMPLKCHWICQMSAIFLQGEFLLPRRRVGEEPEASPGCRGFHRFPNIWLMMLMVSSAHNWEKNGACSHSQQEDGVEPQTDSWWVVSLVGCFTSYLGVFIAPNHHNFFADTFDLHLARHRQHRQGHGLPQSMGG